MEVWLVALICIFGTTSTLSLTAFVVLFIRWRNTVPKPQATQISPREHESIPIRVPYRQEAVQLIEKHRHMDPGYIYYGKPSPTYTTSTLREAFGDAYGSQKTLSNENSISLTEHKSIPAMNKPFQPKDRIPVKWLTASEQLIPFSIPTHLQYTEACELDNRLTYSSEDFIPSPAAHLVPQEYVNLSPKILASDRSSSTTRVVLPPTTERKGTFSSFRRKWSGDSQPDVSALPPREPRSRRDSMKQYSSEEELAFEKKRNHEAPQRRNTLQSLERPRLADQKSIPSTYRGHLSAPLLPDQKSNSPQSNVNGELQTGAVNSTVNLSGANSSHTSLDAADYYSMSSQILNKYGGRRRNQQHLLNRAARPDNQERPPSFASPQHYLPPTDSPK